MSIGKTSNFPNSFLKPDAPAVGDGPVSYTHLDVYKRQIIRSMVIEMVALAAASVVTVASPLSTASSAVTPRRTCTLPEAAAFIRVGH